MKRILFSLVAILAISIVCSAQNTVYFPQVADGFQQGGIAWITAIVLTNTAAPGTAAASGAITFTQDNGTPWTLSYNDGMGGPYSSGTSIPFQIAGGQSRLYVTKANETLTTGFATVTSDSPVTGGVVFVEYADNGNTRIAEAGVAASPALTRQTTFATTGDSNTGVAVANPGSSAATITFQLRGMNGNLVSQPVSRTLGPKGHTAFFIDALFPNMPSQFFGTMQITSDIPIVSTALLIERTGEFATLPIIPLQ
jgi:hypothetical protein